MILAEIDPLRSSAEVLASRMAAAGVPVETRLYRGTTYDFFGLGAVVPEAAQAEEDAARRMRAHFARAELPVIRGPVRRPAPSRSRVHR
jgi:acetyl esterase/lipase